MYEWDSIVRHTFVNLFSNPDIMRVNEVLPYPRVLTIHVHGNLKQFDCIRMLSKNYGINYMDPCITKMVLHVYSMDPRYVFSTI